MLSTEKPYVLVVGIDYSELSRLALHQAFETAREHTQSEVHVLHVRADVHPDRDVEPGQQLPDREVLALALESVQRVVRDDLALFQKAQRRVGVGPFGLVSHVRSGPAASEIAQLADDLRANLVVVGSQGRTGTSRLLLGSVAHAVVNLAPCPVLVVRDRTFRPRASSAELERAHHHTDLAGAVASTPLIFDGN